MTNRRLDERSLYQANGKAVRTIALMELGPKPISSLISKQRPAVGQVLMIGTRLLWNGAWLCLAKGQHIRIAITIEEKE